MSMHIPASSVHRLIGLGIISPDERLRHMTVILVYNGTDPDLKQRKMPMMSADRHNNPTIKAIVFCFFTVNTSKY